MEEFAGIVLVGRVGEDQDAFSARLSAFWSDMLRQHPDDFEQVYAETTEFEDHDGRPTRMYLVEDDAVDWLCGQLDGADLDMLPVDPDDRHSRYEATPPEWMQIEH